jgi:hypothetical protein
MIKVYFIMALLVSTQVFSQIEFIQNSFYEPGFFSELIDAEVYEDNTNIIYVMGVGGFIFVSVADINNPEQIGWFNTGSIYKRFYNGIARGGLAIGAARENGLYFLNISNLNIYNPVLYTIYSNADFTYESVDFINNYAYAAVHEKGVQVLEISNPDNPILVTTLQGLENAWDVYIDGDYLYVADGPGGVKIFSLINPENPVFVGSMNTSGFAGEVIVNNQKAYIALGAAGFDIFSVDNPLTPQFLSNYQIKFGIVNHLDYSNERIFLATWELVEAIDISDPLNPRLSASVDTDQRAMGVAAFNDRVFVTDWRFFRTYTFTDYNVPDIHIKPSVYDFGFQGVNIPIVKEFEIFNLGETNLEITDIVVDDNLFSVFPPNLIIPPESSAMVDVSFLPTSSNLNVNPKLSFHSNDPDESNKQTQLYGGAPRLSPGDPAPDFTLFSLDGEEHILSDYLGKIVLLAFFASW